MLTEDQAAFIVEAIESGQIEESGEYRYNEKTERYELVPFEQDPPPYIPKDLKDFEKYFFKEATFFFRLNTDKYISLTGVLTDKSQRAKFRKCMRNGKLLRIIQPNEKLNIIQIVKTLNK